ncbi:MAG: hypothetical protein F2903_10045 [Actinobacteria bacterium]|uniref:Unannotated protein n=1 Tax=freshwater metagenome TaxID=449393 RepID=A0A6J7RZB4_9ZZZZ|nr:hypothetical protein [Actinomycetota bacterium]
MLSFLKNGDIHNTIRTLTDLAGMCSGDKDKIKYSLLNHAMAMRENLINGHPLFTNIRQLEAELERHEINDITSGRLPSMAADFAAASATAATSSRPSPFTDNSLRLDNAVLALIMAKELAFLNRTIQMISLIASRYQEEQEDAVWGTSESGNGDIETGDGDDNISSSSSYDDDETPSVLVRSHSHSPNDDNHVRATRRPENQLAASFLIASGRIRERFNNLCALIKTNIVLVNAMTTMDRPRDEAARKKQLHAEKLVIWDCFCHFEKYVGLNRGPVVLAFLELRDISVSAWKIMSMFAFSNLFRLTEGTDFTIYSPEDAIFSQGRDYCLPRQESAAMDFGTVVAIEAQDADAADDDTTASVVGGGCF